MKTILIVDDEPHILELYQKELGDEGYEIRAATDGEEALTIAKNEDISLVVLDIKMDKKDGLSTLVELKRAKKDLPVILNSAYSTYKSNFQSWLADDYVVKSSNLDELKNKIEGLLSL
jgi:two-component system response regulator (stage 0 sporulation protein F)